MDDKDYGINPDGFASDAEDYITKGGRKLKPADRARLIQQRSARRMAEMRANEPERMEKLLALKEQIERRNNEALYMDICKRSPIKLIEGSREHKKWLMSVRSDSANQNQDASV